jgi:hypothetical protein
MRDARHRRSTSQDETDLHDEKGAIWIGTLRYGNVSTLDFMQLVDA